MSQPVNLVLLRYHLREWGKWYRTIVTAGLDFSNQSYLDRLHKNGGILIASTAKPLAPDNPNAEAIDQAIINLATPMPDGAGKPHWVKVVRIHYTSLHQSEADKIDTAQLSRATYYRYLQKCERYLTSVLSERSNPISL